MRKLKKNEIDRLKKLCGHTFFSVVNKTKDGRVRVWNCRFGVKSKSPKDYDPEDHGMLLVWDRKAKGFRVLNPETITYLRIRNKILINDVK